MLIMTVFPSPIRILLLRLMGHRVGRNVHISIGTVLCAKTIEIHDNVHVGPLNIIHLRSKLYLGYGSDISFMVIISGRGSFHLGQRSYVSVQTFIDTEADVAIGNYSGTGPRTMIFSHAIFLPPSRGYPRVVRPTQIGNYVWLGGMSFLTAGTQVLNNVMTAPGSILSGKIGPCVYWIAPERTIPMKRLCRAMSREKLLELAKDMICDFARTQNIECTPINGGFRLRDTFFVIDDGLSDGNGDSAIRIILDEKSLQLKSPWYNLITLQCSNNCTGRFHQKFQLHLRKYFGLHFLPCRYQEKEI